ncbi:MAG: Sau3AI family type II restriction endonuclease [Paludibacteraceae bacterium]
MQLPYDKTSAESIWQYSAGLLHHTLRDFASQDYVEEDGGKGSLGKMVEEIYFHIRNNNRAEADFPEAGMELKCTPLKKGTKEQLLIKERLVCNMIDYMAVVNEDFEHSHFYTKCRLMLLLFYLHVKGANKLDLEFLLSVLWNFPEKDIAIIRQDYETIVNKIKAGKAHELSEGDTLYLGACRKGQTGDALRSQPYSGEKALGRAFSLKPAYMRIILDWALKTGKNHLNAIRPELSGLVSVEDLRTRSFEEIVINRFAPYLGMEYHAIASVLDIDISNAPKNTFAILASAIASRSRAFNVNQTEEFLKAGMMMKTVRVQANGNIKEAMAFENIDYQEVYENSEWVDSRLYEIFSGRFLFVVFKEKHQGQNDYVLDNIFFWTMPQADLAIAEEYWKHIRKNVLEDHVDHRYFWKANTHKLFHVRPKAAKAKDRTANPLGERHEPCKKFCYWFNNDYVRNIVNTNTK